MPTYDYICNDCENTYEYFQSMSDTPKKECPDCENMYEYFQSMSDTPKKECPNCKKDNLRRVISGGTGLIFKGSGYYLTDYKNKKSETSENNKVKSKKKDKKNKKKIES